MPHRICQVRVRACDWRKCDPPGRAAQPPYFDCISVAALNSALKSAPVSIVIGFAGRHRAHDPVHKHIASLSQGEAVVINDRQVRTPDGRTVGKLASKTDLKSSAQVTGSVSGILVRTREQTPTEYQAGLKADRWETVLVELVLPRP